MSRRDINNSRDDLKMQSKHNEQQQGGYQERLHQALKQDACMKTPTVFIVDDHAALREGLAQLLKAHGLQVEAYSSGREFLAAYTQQRPGCLLLDMTMPGMDGAAVQAALIERGALIPVIFLSGHGDIPTAVRAVRAGALNFLEKPVLGTELLEQVQRALALDQQRRRGQARIDAIQSRFQGLSPRERQVMALLVDGFSNRQIAHQLGLSPRTIEAHRAHVMQKMLVENLPELVKLSAACFQDQPDSAGYP